MVARYHQRIGRRVTRALVGTAVGLLIAANSAYLGSSPMCGLSSRWDRNRRPVSTFLSEAEGSPSAKKASSGAPSSRRPDGYYPLQYLILSREERIAFDELFISTSSELALYLPNLAEGRDNPTSDAVLKHCILKEWNFVTMDWFGRGDSSGKLMNATLTRWKTDVISLLDNLHCLLPRKKNHKKAVLVGHGVGVWISVLVALQRPDLVRGIVGIGGDPDFTEDLLWKQLPVEEKEAIMRDGFREIRWGSRKQKNVYPITSALIRDGRDNLILRGGRNSLNISCPVRLVHDLKDIEVPPETSVKLADCINHLDVVVNMPKFGTLGVLESLDQCFAATPDIYNVRMDTL